MMVGRKRLYAPKPVRKLAKRSKYSAPVYGISSFTSRGPRFGAPLGPVLKTKFRIAGCSQLNGGAAGAIATLACAPNSLNDPFYTLGTGQPRGYDQLTALYGRYRVKSCKVNIKFLNSNASTLGPFVCGFSVTDTTTAPTSFKDVIECGYSVWDAQIGDYSGKSDLSMFIDMAKFKGRPITDDEMGANVGSDPVDLCVLHLFVQAASNAIDLGAVDVLITMDFEAELFDPIVVAAS